MKSIKHTAALAATILSAALMIGACGKKAESTAAPVSMTAAVESASAAAEPTSASEAAPESSGEAGEEKTDMPGMPNPMKKAESSEDFKAIGLTLVLPENKEIYKDPAYYIIDGQTAQISFHDERVQSKAVARTAKEELGDISGIYYNFNDEKEQHIEAVTASGDKIDIKIQFLVDGSDIPGILASWNYKGYNYTLWEDEGKKDVESVADLAVEIAQGSAQS